MTFGKNFSTTWIQSYSSIWSCFCHAFQAAARYVSHGSIRLLHKKCNLIPIQTSLKTNWSRPHKTLLLETWNTWDSWLLDWSRKKNRFSNHSIYWKASTQKNLRTYYLKFHFPKLSNTECVLLHIWQTLKEQVHYLNLCSIKTIRSMVAFFAQGGYSIWVHHISRALLYYPTTLLAYTILL